MSTEYHVEYRIEVNAETPREAAEKVATILAGGGAERGVYHVRRHSASGTAHWEEAFDLGECAHCDARAEDGADLGYGPNGDLCYECSMREQGYTECPNCGEWKPVGEIYDYDFPNGKVTMCMECKHNADRSG